MNVLAVVLVWGGFLLIAPSLFPVSRITEADTGRAFLGSIGTAWQTRKGVISLVDENGEAKPAVVLGSEYPDISGFAVSPEGDVMGATGYGVFVSKDKGENFSLKKIGDIDEGANVADISFGKNNPYGVISAFKNGEGVIMVTADNFDNFTEIFREKRTVSYSAAFLGDFLYVGLSDGRLLRYSFKDGSWSRLAGFSSALAHLAAGGGRLYASPRSGGFYVSLDGGSNFTRQKFLDSYAGANKFKKMIVDPAAPEIVYAITDYGFIRTVNGGETWELFASLPVSGNALTALDAAPGTLLVASKKEVLESRDGGKSWKVFNPKTSRDISTIIKVHGRIVVGTRN